jgi:hypothetical protein
VVLYHFQSPSRVATIEEEEEEEAPLLKNKLSSEERESERERQAHTRGSSTAPLRASEKGGTGGGNLWELMGTYGELIGI